jgi:hypothetical protein
MCLKVINKKSNQFKHAQKYIRSACPAVSLPLGRIVATICVIGTLDHGLKKYKMKRN